MFPSYGLRATFQMAAEDLPVFLHMAAEDIPIFLLQMSKRSNWSGMASQAGTARRQAIQGRGQEDKALSDNTGKFRNKLDIYQ